MTARHVGVTCLNLVGGFLLGLLLAGGLAGWQAWQSLVELGRLARQDAGGGGLVALGLVSFTQALRVLVWGALGGVAGALLACWEGSRRKRISVLALLGIAALAAVLVHARWRRWI